MFGYILPEKPELKIREYELFRAYYCGVCKSMGKRFGQLSRFTLNYDSTFLALLLSSLFEEKIHTCNERCIAHPVKKRSIAKNSKLIDYASDMNVILAYYNLKDDWKDERSVVSATAAGMLYTAYIKLCRKYPEKCAIIEKRLKELSDLEMQGCTSMDMAAEPFARLMEEIMICDCVSMDKELEKIIRWMGYNIGKWIYILDAFDDLEKDLKKNSYNPLLRQFGYTDESVDGFKNRIKDRVEFNLTQTLSQISKAYNLLKPKSNSGLLENILYMGMLRKTEQILQIGSCRKIEESV